MKSLRSFPKLISAVLLVCAASLAWSCSDDDTGDDAFIPTFTLPEQPVIKNNYASQNNTITVVASHDVSWTAAKTDEQADWLTITSASGKGNGNIVFTLTEKDTPGRRSTTIAVTGTSERDSRTLSGTVTVEQMGSEPTIVMEPVGSVSLPWTGAEAYTVQIVSNVNWRAELTVVSGGEGWIAKTAPAADVEGDGAVVLSVSENESTESRQAKLTVVYVDDPTVKAELTINQQKQGERHRIEFAGMTTLLGNDGNTTLEYAPAGGGESVILNDVEVEVGTDLTTVYYMEEIPDGEYELKKVGSVEINALFTLSNGQISYVERWNPAFGCFGGESEERPIAIGKRSDLEALASSVNAGESYAGIYFVQTADIALGGSWTAIGPSDKKFSGNYDGRDFAITGLKIAATAAGQGLFGYIGGVAASEDGTKPAVAAALRNITVKGAGSTPSDNDSDAGFDITATAGFVGGIAANVTGNTVVSNCRNYAHVRVTISTGANGAGNSGGVIGEVGGTDVSIDKCVNYGKIVVYSASNTLVNNVGGVIGNNSDTVTACYNTGIVTGGSYVGGVAGYNWGTITDCYNEGSITGEGCGGGVVGCNRDTVIDCYNTGIVTGVNTVSGVVGENMGTVTDCYNEGSVNGNDNTGGVVGFGDGDGGTVTDCYNTGNITGNNKVGGVVGGLDDDSSGRTVIGCYNTGIVTGISYVGGVIGENNGTNSVVTDCYNTGGITGGTYVGGVVGHNSHTGSVTNCYNTGSVTGDESVGGVVGLSDGDAAVTNCYYYVDCCANSDSYGTALTNEQMLRAESFEGFDFETVWTMDGNPGYPYPKLINNFHTAVYAPIANSGDANGDGTVNAVDALVAMRYVLGVSTESLTPEQIAAADFNGDGAVNAVDAMLIMRFSLGLIEAVVSDPE